MKRAVVTGGTRGIGREICRVFSEAGYAVVALYSKSEEDAARAREALPAVSFVRADVSDEEAVQRTFADLLAPDVLVCNAGIDFFSQIQDVGAEDLSRVIDVNLKGVVLCCKHAVKKMLSRGGAPAGEHLLHRVGAIVTVSSVWGETGASCESVYAASKGGVIAFSKSLAKELAPAGIRVNCVSPGVIDTEMNARLCEAERRALEEEIPLGRFGRAEEVARAVHFLAESGYITGQVLGVNGGFLI